MIQDNFNNHQRSKNGQPHAYSLHEPLGNTNYTLTIYIVMRILKLIRGQMGFEAMLEYIDKFIEKNENRHPQFPKAFSLAMNNQKLETIYENTVHYQKDSMDQK